MGMGGRGVGECGVEEWSQWVAAFAAVCALSFAGWQHLQLRRQVRLKLISDFMVGFAADDRIQDAFYDIEYDEFVYGPNFHGSEEEKNIDRLLRHFSNLALSWEAKLVNLDDLQPANYYFQRVSENKGIVKYLDYIQNWTLKQGVKKHPYDSFLRLAKQLRKVS